MTRGAHQDGTPPIVWPREITYLTKPRLSPTFPTSLLPFLYDPPNHQPPKSPCPPVRHPAHAQIRKITDTAHPATGQSGLFARKKLAGGTLITPYSGVIHATIEEEVDEHEDSDYDLCLIRVSASHPRNPYPGRHVSIGIDAAKAGNAGRFVNDYRGIGPAPNAEFRVSKDASGHLVMEIWTLKTGLAKGEEVLVSYGKGWWGARNGS